MRKNILEALECGWLSISDLLSKLPDNVKDAVVAEVHILVDDGCVKLVKMSDGSVRLRMTAVGRDLLRADRVSERIGFRPV